MLYHFHLDLYAYVHASTLAIQKFENLKTLWLNSLYTGSLRFGFPVTKTVETLTLDSGNEAPRDAIDSRLTLRKVFMVFPNVCSLCIKPNAWSELQAYKIG
ncbi:hypothetical protein R6Q59_023655 [Mikania micrantha]